MESSEAQKVINAFDDHLLKPLIIVALYYGLRRSEILGLKWSAIDFEKDKIEISHTVLKYGSHFEERDRTKTASSRRILGLIPEVKEVLLSLQEQQKKNKKALRKLYMKNDYVFTWPDGRIIQPDYVSNAFQKVLKKNKLPKMRFHDLRHSCASLLYEKGMEIKDIQQWLGHSSISTTSDIYTHISNLHMKNLAESLQGSFKLAGG